MSIKPVCHHMTKHDNVILLNHFVCISSPELDLSRSKSCNLKHRWNFNSLVRVSDRVYNCAVARLLKLELNQPDAVLYHSDAGGLYKG